MPPTSRELSSEADSCRYNQCVARFRAICGGLHILRASGREEGQCVEAEFASLDGRGSDGSGRCGIARLLVEYYRAVGGAEAAERRFRGGFAGSI